MPRGIFWIIKLHRTFNIYPELDPTETLCQCRRQRWNLYYCTHLLITFSTSLIMSYHLFENDFQH